MLFLASKLSRNVLILTQFLNVLFPSLVRSFASYLQPWNCCVLQLNRVFHAHWLLFNLFSLFDSGHGKALISALRTLS